MKTKKIVADTMPLALKKVRQELGDNAIIVNTRAVKTGGVFGLFAKQKYEVTAYSIDKERPVINQKPSFEAKEKAAYDKGETYIYEGQNDERPSSGFHKSPQKLYNFYSQPSSAAEKPAQSSQESEKQTQFSSVIKEQILANQATEKQHEASSLTEKPVPSASNETQLLAELQDMRKMMMTFMMNNQQGDALPSKLAIYIERLKANGVDGEVIEHIVASLLKKHESITDLDEEVVRQEIFSTIKEMLEKRLPESNTIQESTRMINVIGPTGVGKTTSIAKLATEQVLKQKRRVAMITTDVYRIAAVEQLKTYAGILNVPIEVVRSAEELEKSLQTLKNYDLIYMDTTGRNYKEIKHRESINEFLNHPLKSDNYLVLSLTTKFEDMKILLEEFLESPVRKLILTKFDETSSYGSILNIAYKYPYQLAYITNGQSVPEDITGMNAAMLAGYLVGEDK